MKETQSRSRQGQPTTVVRLTIVCALPNSGNAAHSLAQVLAVGGAWSEKRGCLIEVIAIDESPEGSNERAKTFGPVKLVRHSFREPWRYFLDRILAHAAGDWILVASELALDRVERIAAILETLDRSPRPTVGLVADEAEALRRTQLGDPHCTVSSQQVAVFVAPRQIVIRATRALPEVSSSFPMNDWWQSVEEICRREEPDKPIELLTLPVWQSTVGSSREAPIRRSQELSAVLATAVTRSANRDVRILATVSLVALLLAAALSGRLGTIASWASSCTGLSTLSLWYLQKLVLPVVARVSVALKFSAEVLASRLHVAAYLNLLVGVLLAFACLPPNGFSWQPTLDIAAVTIATAVAIMGVHLLCWARLLRCLAKQPRAAESG